MELWSFVAMFVRRWRVVVPVLALSLLASFTLSRLAKIEYEYTGSVVVLPKNPPKQRNGELVNPWNSADAYSDQFARLMVEAAGTEEFEEKAEGAGVEADFEVTMGTEKLAVVGFTTRDESAEVARDSYRRLEDTFAAQLEARQRALNAPPETWYGLLTLKPPFDPKQVKTRSQFPILVAALGVLAAMVLASFAEMVAVVRRRRGAAAPAVGGGDGDGEPRWWEPPGDAGPKGGAVDVLGGGAGPEMGWPDDRYFDPEFEPGPGDRPVGPPPDWVPRGEVAAGPERPAVSAPAEPGAAPDGAAELDALAGGDRPRPAAVVGGSAIIVFVLLLAGLFVGLRRGQADESLRLSYQRSPGQVGASAPDGGSTVTGAAAAPGPPGTDGVAAPAEGSSTTRPGSSPSTVPGPPAAGPAPGAPAAGTTGRTEGTPPGAPTTTARRVTPTLELSQSTVDLPWPANGPVLSWEVEHVEGATVVVNGPGGEVLGSSFTGQVTACPRPGQTPCDPDPGAYRFTLTVWLPDGVQPAPVQRTLMVRAAPTL